MDHVARQMLPAGLDRVIEGGCASQLSDNIAVAASLIAQLIRGNIPDVALGIARSAPIVEQAGMKISRYGA